MRSRTLRGDSRTQTMATDHDDADIPDSGGVFTFGKSRFADNLPNKFWIRNDEVLQAACGDEHTVLVAGSGRVFVFGDNSYGQLGLGNMKPQTKPTCIKSLKSEKASVVGCGKSHTLIGTDSGKLYAFGHNTDGQCGMEGMTTCETPEEVQLDRNVKFTQLSGGSCHSAALSESGHVYVWGDNSEGQLGLGDDTDSVEQPTKLKSVKEEVTHISCGYYHTALVTASGKLYTFGESENGKLGLGNGVQANIPTRVDIQEKVRIVSCGGNHTAAVTVSGRVYTFGDGQNGQLGQGTNVLECSTPSLVSSIKDLKIVFTTCGENFTTVTSAKGQLLTFGDGRHGKLALGAENFTNQFRPFRVPRFSKFEVTQVRCGGCHMIVLARKRDMQDSEEEIMDPLNSTFANSLRLSVDGDLGASARDRRRATRETPEPLSRTLPALASKTLPPLNSTFSSKLKPLTNHQGMPQTLDKRKLPDAHFGQGDQKKRAQESDSDVSVTPEGSTDEEEEAPYELKNKREQMKKQSERISTAKQRIPAPRNRKAAPPESEEESEEEEDSEEEPTFKSKVKPNTVKQNGKGKHSKFVDSEEDVDSGAGSEEYEKPSRFKKTGNKNVKKQNKKKILDSDEEDSEEELPSKKNARKKHDDEELEDESEEEITKKQTKKASPAKKSGFSLFGKNKKVIISDDDEDEEDEEEETKNKNKKNASKEKKKIDDDKTGDDSEIEKEENEKAKNDGKEKPAQPEEKKSRACVIL